jgi:hypothetical protein
MSGPPDPGELVEISVWLTSQASRLGFPDHAGRGSCGKTASKRGNGDLMSNAKPVAGSVPSAAVDVRGRPVLGRTGHEPHSDSGPSVVSPKRDL